MKPFERPKTEKNGEQWLPDHPWCPNGQTDYGISEVKTCVSVLLDLSVCRHVSVCILVSVCCGICQCVDMCQCVAVSVSV